MHDSFSDLCMVLRMAGSVSYLDLEFDLVEVGINGEVEVVPKIDRSNERIQLPLKTVGPYKL